MAAVLRKMSHSEEAFRKRRPSYSIMEVSIPSGNIKIRILKSLHSKPTILNNDLGQPIEKPLVQPASLRDYKEGGSYDFYIEHED